MFLPERGILTYNYHVINKFFGLVLANYDYDLERSTRTREEFPQNRIFQFSSRGNQTISNPKTLTNSPKAAHSSSAQKWRPDHPARIFEFPTLPRGHRACVMRILACP